MSLFVCGEKIVWILFLVVVKKFCIFSLSTYAESHGELAQCLSRCCLTCVCGVGEQHRNAPGKPAQRLAVGLCRTNRWAIAACS